MLKLTLNAIAKFLCGIISISILIFLPAGTLDYFGGKLLLLTLFAPMLICGIIMLIFSPTLLASRLDFKEKQKGQRTVDRKSVG